MTGLFSLQALPHLRELSWLQILQFMMCFILYQMWQVVLQYRQDIMALILRRFRKRTADLVAKASAYATTTASIKFTHSFEREDELSEAILDYLCSIDSAFRLRYMVNFTVDNMEVFTVDEKRGIQARVDEVALNKDTGIVKSIAYTLSSEKLTLTEMKNWCEERRRKFRARKNSRLQDYQWYFETMDEKSGGDNNGMLFSRAKFSTTRTLRNLYGEAVEQVRGRVFKFLYEREWYEKRGIPYTLGLALCGNPGTGKTSLIKAIANESKRHIFSVKINDSTPEQIFVNLFQSDLVRVWDNINNRVEVIEIPISERIYILEDIDAMTKLVYKRELQDMLAKQEKEKETELSPTEREALHNKREYEKRVGLRKLTLSTILNVLDGVLETPGRILIITTNHVEKLDSAFIRPGRIDSIIRFGMCAGPMIMEIASDFFEEPKDSSLLEFGGKFTPAEIQEFILCSRSTEDFRQKLIERSPLGSLA